MRRTHGRHRNDGVALVLVLLFVTLLTVIVVEFSYEAQVEASFASNQGSDFEACLAAKSAVAEGIAALATDLLDAEYNGEPFYDSAMDGWANGVSFGAANNGTANASIDDEYGKINLNALLDTSQGDEPVERESLVNALREFFFMRLADDSDSSAEAIIDGILDWIDYNDEDSERPEGAENDYYNDLENPYSAKNGPMDSIEELLLIKGITPKLYFGSRDEEEEQLPLSEYLTVHGDWVGRVNINTAEPEVIAAMLAGFSGSGADLAMAEQTYEDVRIEPMRNAGQLGAIPGFPQTPTQPKQPKQPNAANNQNQQNAVEQTQLPPFIVASNVFRIYGDGMLEDIMVRVEAYVWRTPTDMTDLEAAAQLSSDQSQEAAIPAEPFRILSWKVIR